MNKHTVIGRLKTVSIYDPYFLVDEKRGIRIWFPKSYKSRGVKPYPVLYMLDGQNLFDRSTSFAGQEWEIDESITNHEDAHQIRPWVVVGLDNSKDRLSEYFPRFSEIAIGPLAYRAEITFNFLTKQVIPYVERHYNVQKTRAGRAFGGSSMGGLMALDALLKYNSYFSQIYCFSPSFTMYKYGMNEVPPIKEAVGNNSTMTSVLKKMAAPKIVNSVKLALGSGGQGEYEKECLKNVKKMDTYLKANGWDDKHLSLYLYPDKEHNEDQWNEAFYQAYWWMNS